MEPTFESGDVHFADRHSYRDAEPERGDVVVVAPDGGDEFLVKRVVGLPGDEVKMIWGRIYIDGVLLEEPYRHPENGWCMLPVRLGAGDYWIIGDNRDVSSHHTVTRDEIVGRVRRAS